MKLLKLFLLLFPLISMCQKRFDIIGQKLKQNNKYEYVYGFENNYAVFRTFDKKMGVIDSIGNVIIKPIFSFIHNNKKLKNLFEVGNSVNTKFKRGFIDLRGNIKIPIVYDDVFYFEEGLIRVSKDNKSGVLDTLNNIILPNKFDNISFDNNLIIAEINERNYLYDVKGKLISDLNFSEISNFTNNMAIAMFLNNSNFIIDNQGNIVLKSIKNYSFEKILNGGLFLVKDKLNSKKGILNSKGQFIIKCKYDAIEQVKSFFIAKSNGKKGFISMDDSIVKPFVYDDIYFSYFDDVVSLDGNNLGNNYIVKKDNLFGVINPNLEYEIIPIRYKNIRTLFNSYYLVQNSENKNGLFFKNGEKLLKEDYKFYNVFENSIFASNNNNQFIITLENLKYHEEAVLSEEFMDYLNVQEYPKSSNQIIKHQGKFGVINYKNKIIIPCEYEIIENIYLSDAFIVFKNHKYGIVNTDNRIIIELEYDKFEIIKEVIEFSKNNTIIKKYHLIN
ncbi:WG repeat-containing protein [Flavobacterium sp.]|uniref:WG repeat-containing protein n=1 Tax=Flavobacterium sp. TaxID=239 RepID=UPI00375196E1